MILNRLTLVNFGIYRGLKDFNLRPTHQQPIIIIGGKNGAGKTTLLEAIRLCLYGPLALDQQTRPSKAAYEQYLRQRIHHATNGVIPIDMASVELEFEYALAGERHIYAIKREWHDKPKRFQEKLQVFEDGQLLSDMGTGQWQDFLRGLIPPGLSQLFFFDGEKIQALAEGGANNLALAQATKALLGLNIVEQLETDLAIYRRRQQKRSDLDSAERQIELLEDELDQVKTSLQQIEAEQAQLTAKYNEIDKNIELQEAEIARVGGGFARQRDEYKDAQFRLEAEIEQVEQAIRDLCAGLLPFAIAPEYATAVKEQLLREAEYQQWQASQSFIEQKVDVIQAEIEKDEFWQGTGAEILVDLQKAVSQRVTETLQRMVELPDEVQQTRLLHQVSALEQRQLLQWIDESQTKTPHQLQQLTTRLTQLNQQRQEAEQALQRVPADDVLAPLVETLNKHNQEKGAIIEQQNQQEAEWRKLDLYREELKRKLHQAKDKKEYYQQLSSWIQNVVDVELVMDDFTARLTELRIHQLQEAFIRNFNRLCRKDRLVDAVEIDPRDFSVTLIGADGQVTPKSDLSAGEKQIYAIAMLWALRQVSGRPLPVIIDTPLGRLDSDHRQNLVERYFPRASHQIILFSTDTEVDAEFFAAMQPNITRAYHLEHDEAQKATEVSEGYFWSTNGQGAQ
ncbi:DNA sulfur modification protein DndD [Chloroflexota bacterium]